MEIIKEGNNYKIIGLKDELVLNKEDLVSLTDTLESFKDNNPIVFDGTYEVIDFDDINSLRLGYYHNGKEDFIKNILLLDIEVESLYRIGEAHLIYNFVYDSDNKEERISSVYIEKRNKSMIAEGSVTNRYLKSHLSQEVRDSLLDISNLEIRVNGQKINTYDFFNEVNVVGYKVNISSDT